MESSSALPVPAEGLLITGSPTVVGSCATSAWPAGFGVSGMSVSAGSAMLASAAPRLTGLMSLAATIPELGAPLKAAFMYSSLGAV